MSAWVVESLLLRCLASVRLEKCLVREVTMLSRCVCVMIIALRMSHHYAVISSRQLISTYQREHWLQTAPLVRAHNGKCDERQVVHL